jgi:hypothetical protein
LSETSGNGAVSRWSLEREDGYLDDRAELEATYPYVGRVLDAIEAQFAVVPTLNSRKITGNVWLYKTPQAFGAPPLYVYYDVDDGERVVTLFSVSRAD